MPVSEVWDKYTEPRHIVNWNFATEEWECPHAESDLVPGGKFSYRMSAKDKSMEFDFAGQFARVETGRLLTYTLDDGRQVKVNFDAESDVSTTVTVTFDPDTENDEEFQRMGWQSILDTFKNYVEAHIKHSI